MEYTPEPLFDLGTEGQSDTMPRRPMPVSGEHVVNITPATEAYNRLAMDAASTGYLYETVRRPVQGIAPYEFNEKEEATKTVMNSLNPGECAFYYNANVDVDGVKEFYDEHPNDPNSRVLSHCAFFNILPNETPEQAVVRHELHIVPLGTVKSPGSLYEPKQHTTANVNGTIARRNTLPVSMIMGYYLRWGIPLPVDLPSQTGKDSHTKGQRPVLQLEQITNLRVYDLRYWPMIVTLAKFFHTYVAAYRAAFAAANVAGAPAPVPELTLADIAKNNDLFRAPNLPPPRYIQAAYNQFLCAASMATIAGQPGDAVARLQEMLHVAMTTDNAGAGANKTLSQYWQASLLAYRQGTLMHDHMRAGLSLTNAPADQDMAYLPM